MSLIKLGIVRKKLNSSYERLNYNRIQQRFYSVNYISLIFALF